MSCYGNRRVKVIKERESNLSSVMVAQNFK